MTVVFERPPVPVPVVTGPGADRALERDLEWDIVEEWGLQSFPASDPPSNW